MKESSHDKVLQEYKVKKPVELLAFLLENQARKSRNAVKSLLAHKQIKVNNKLVTQFDHRLNSGDTVFVMKYNQARKRRKLKGLSLIYEDEYLIVVDKEAAFLSVGTDREKTRTVYHILNEYLKGQKNKEARVYVVHRMDRDVSGIMIFVKEQDIQTMFQQNWDKIVSQYNYSAIVEGQPELPAGTVTSWLTEDKNFVMRSSTTDNGGLKSVTHYKTLDSTGRYSLLNFKQETRRKNQVRVQMQSIGHPIVGDKKYGAKGSPIKRIALHADYMEIVHPVSGQKMEFQSNLPKLMKEFLSTKRESEKNTITKIKRSHEPGNGTDSPAS